MPIGYDQEVQLRISTSTEGGAELDRLTSKMEGLEAELGNIAKASKEANAAQLEAANRLNEARAKQDEIRRTLAATNDAYKALMDQVRKGGESQKQYAAEAAATKQRMDQLRASLNTAGQQTATLNEEYKRAAAQSRFLSSEQRRVSAELKETGSAVERVRARLRELKDSAKESAGAFDGLRGKLVAAAAALGGFIGIKRGFEEVAKSAESLDVGMRKIEAAILATGGAAGLTANDIGAMAKRLDEATLGSAEGFRNAAAKLLTFKSISKDTFETTLKLAQDLAATGFGTLESNVVQLGKALENPKQGISALAEAGVTFTDKQKAVIAYLVETGKQAQAQKVILEAVAGQVSGVAAAMGQGMSGAADLVGKRFTDLKEQIGSGILPALTSLYNGIASVFQRMTDSGAVERFGAVLGRVFQGAGDAFMRFVGQVDLDALAARMSTWADQSGEAVSRWIGYIESAGSTAKLVFSAIFTGASTIQAGIYKLGEAFAGVASNIQSGLALILDGMSNVTFGDLSAKFKGWAEEVRMSAKATWSVSEAYADEASKAFDRAAESAATFQTSWAALTASTPEAAAAVEQVGAQASLTADQVEALGENTDFVNGQLIRVNQSSAAAVTGLANVSDAAVTAAEKQAALAIKLAELETEFAKLGLTSTATLKRQADEAEVAFNRIKSSGLASTRDLKEAFRVYAERAIAANNGVANDTLRVQAAMNGYRIEVDAAGKAMLIAADSASRMRDGISESGSAAKKSAANFRELADAADDLATAQERANKAALDNSYLSGSRDGVSLDTQTILYKQGASVAEAKAASEYFNEIMNRKLAQTSGNTGVNGPDFNALSRAAADESILLARAQLSGATVDMGTAFSDQLSKELATTKFGMTPDSGLKSLQTATSNAGSAASASTTVVFNVNGRPTKINVGSSSDVESLRSLLNQLEFDASRSS